MKTQPDTNTKVVPFRGEMYEPIPPATPPQQSSGAFIAFGLVCLVGMGAAIGASVTYNSTDQVQIREMKSQLQHWKNVEKQICKGG